MSIAQAAPGCKFGNLEEHVLGAALATSSTSGSCRRMVATGREDAASTQPDHTQSIPHATNPADGETFHPSGNRVCKGVALSGGAVGCKCAVGPKIAT